MNEHGDALAPGTRIAEFEIVRELGSGGFGVTYLARDRALERMVAVKEYLPRYWGVRGPDGTVGPRASSSEADYAWGLRRFVEEARALARLRHAGIVGVHRIIEAGGTAYMVMEYVEGRSLAEEIRSSGPLPEDRVREILTGLAGGLAQVHAAGMLHRDIKPANVMLRAGDGSPVLVDFGAARQQMGRQSRSITAVLTPGYAPIEQYSARGRQGPWTDVYALGAVAYEALSGRAPDDAPERAMRDELPPVERVAASPVSAELAGAVAAALAMDAGARPQEMGELVGLLGGEGEVRVRPELAAVEGEAAKIPWGNGERTSAAQPAPEQTATRRWLLWGSGAAVAGVAALVVSLPRDDGEVSDDGEVADSGVVSDSGVFSDCAECPKMVVVPAGSYMMGSPESEEGRSDNEGPRRRVTISAPFAVGVHEVTGAEWGACVDAGGCREEVRGGGSWSVSFVSWEDAHRYVAWLSRTTGETYRLPSEAEWEYVARAGTATARYWGEGTAGQCAYANGADAAWSSGEAEMRDSAGTRWVACRDGHSGKAPVGTFSPNAFGLHDVLGNVWEWVEDCWHDDYAGAPTDGSVWTEGGDCSFSVVRGGSANSPPGSLRSAMRVRHPAHRDAFLRYSVRYRDGLVVGFRVARTIN